MFRLALVIALMAGLPAAAQHTHDHARHSDNETQPVEVGQSAFAAMAEIVEMLRRNSDTDWTSVDIPALQRHLVDMELLATQSVAEESAANGYVQFRVTGASNVVDALHRMVPAHAPFLDAETGWSTEVERDESGVIVRVKGDEQVIRALGFHGLMTIGAHHQEHHLGIATGTMAHH